MKMSILSSANNPKLNVELHIEDEITQAQQAMERQRFSWGQAIMLREQTVGSPLCGHKTDLYDELIQESRDAFLQAWQKYQALSNTP